MAVRIYDLQFSYFKQLMLVQIRPHTQTKAHMSLISLQHVPTITLSVFSKLCQTRESRLQPLQEWNLFSMSYCYSTCRIYVIFFYLILTLQVGAIYIWSYVYMIMRVFANKTSEDIDTHDSTISITFSGEPSETFSGTCTEALLPSSDCPSSDDHSDQVELPRTRSVGKVKVFKLYYLKKRYFLL